MADVDTNYFVVNGISSGRQENRVPMNLTNVIIALSLLPQLLYLNISDIVLP